VAVETEVFAPLAARHARLVGLPELPIVYVPQPVSHQPRETCRRYLKGNDPLTGRAVLEELVEGLTRPLPAREGEEAEETLPRLVGPDTEDNLRQLFLEKRWTDYLPIILPTEERVAEMLKGTSHPPEEVVGELRAGYEAAVFTVEQVAANAVMAGARPEHLPVILALAASGVPAILSSTQSFARMIVVNGPIRNEIGMNCGCGAMGPFNLANAVIGRAATLLAINLGLGGVPNETYWGSQGNNLNYNHVTFAENEEALPPGWKPFHVQKGFRPEESVVSLFHGYGLWHWKNTYEDAKHKMMLRMADWVLPSGAYQSGYALLLDPLVAEELVKEGFGSKEALSEYIYQNSLLPLEEFWRYHLVEGFSLPAADKGIEPYASWRKLSPDTLVNRYRSPEEISVLVVGGRTNVFWQMGDWRFMGSFSIDEWR
jgi:hypothetical protein